jgi:hypothetical protein
MSAWSEAMSLWRDPSGQTVTEFLLSSGLVLITLVGAGWMLHVEWHRAKCAYLVFQSAHTRLVGSIALTSSVVKITEDDQGVNAEAECGKASETVHLNKLEAIQW